MRVMQIDLEDCDVKQHRTKLTIEFTSNVGSLVSWAPRGLNPNWKVPRVPLNIQGSALLFLFQATFPKRYLKLRGDWVLRHPTPATEENFSERRTCLSLLPHTGTLKYHHLTSHTALQHAVTSFAQQSLCVHFLWQFQETQRWKDQIPALHEVFLQPNCKLLDSLWIMISFQAMQSESRSVMYDSLLPHGQSWNSLGHSTGVGSLSLLQGIFPIQGSNQGLPHCRQMLYCLSYKGSPNATVTVS